MLKLSERVGELACWKEVPESSRGPVFRSSPILHLHRFLRTSPICQSKISSSAAGSNAVRLGVLIGRLHSLWNTAARPEKFGIQLWSGRSGFRASKPDHDLLTTYVAVDVRYRSWHFGWEEETNLGSCRPDGLVTCHQSVGSRTFSHKAGSWNNARTWCCMIRR